MKKRQHDDKRHHAPTTAVELLKTFGDPSMARVPLGTLRKFNDDKGFSPEAVQYLADSEHWAMHMSELVLGRVDEFDLYANQYAQALPAVDPSDLPKYCGKHTQNRRIDLALTNSGFRTGRQFLGEGAATFFASTYPAPESINHIPVAVVGCGVAGTLVTYALRRLGFTNVEVFERAKRFGIWSQNNVSGLSRNNPRQLQFYESVLGPAPGPGSEITEFLERLSISPEDADITGITPGNMRHEIKFRKGKSRTFPIVVNTIGIGKPRELSDPSRMTTSATASQAGSRWQKVLRRGDVEGKRIVLIGLGNSTAEMLFQIHNLMDRGVAVDYRVLTHYPENVVFNPNSTFVVKGKEYRVFRDISLPNLVDFQGDLPRSRQDYYRALHDGKILYGINRWEVEGKIMHLYRPGMSQIETIPFDRVMTLIGYANSPEIMGKMGCTYDPSNKCALFDYDGEFSRKCVVDPDKRLYKGYYGFGSVLETPFNRNAIVIPGMLHRIGDLLFGIIMRATEASLAH